MTEDAMTDDEILDEYGWSLDCESPLEISLINEPSSRASGRAAEILLEYIKELWLNDGEIIN